MPTPETGPIGNELYSWLMMEDAAQMTTTPKKVKDMGGNSSMLYLGIGKVGFNEAVDMTKTSTEINNTVDKVANISVTQGVDLDAIETNSNASKVKTDFITVTQNVDLDAIETNSNASKVKTDFITVTQNVDLDTIESQAAASKIKTDFLTVTQPVDLDTIESRVNELDASVILKGSWDASAGTFPGAGIAQAGWSYINTHATEVTIDGIKFNQYDRIVAILDNASTSTYASNWLKLDYTDAVLSVAGRTGTITLTTADVAASTDKNYVTDAKLVVVNNTSNTNTGDQTSIVGITGTKAQFNAAVSDGNIVYEGDNSTIAGITFIIDGGGSAITTGIKGDLEIPFACTINRVTMLADQSGSIVVDVWKDTYANYPPTGADSIAAGAKPTISTALKSQDSTLTGWTVSVSAGDILRFNVDSITTITRVTISLKITKS